MRQKITLYFLLLFPFAVHAQEFNIKTTLGGAWITRKEYMQLCLEALKTTSADKDAVAVCNCRADKINLVYTQKDIMRFTKHAGKDSISIDIAGLIDSKPEIKRQVTECLTGSGKTISIATNLMADTMLKRCIADFMELPGKKPDSLRVREVCACQIKVINEGKKPDEYYDQLGNPNSNAYFEMLYKCGSPFDDGLETDNSWTADKAKDIAGPETDTIRVLNIKGMTFVRMKTGNLIQWWLFDTGATDLLIGRQTETELRKEMIIHELNFLGTKEYEMANGIIDTCRRYRINNVRIGNFYIDNLVVAVSDKARRIIVGKGLLNKFSTWALDNRNNLLILKK